MLKRRMQSVQWAAALIIILNLRQSKKAVLLPLLRAAGNDRAAAGQYGQLVRKSGNHRPAGQLKQRFIPAHPPRGSPGKDNSRMRCHCVLLRIDSVLAVQSHTI
ncbi:hypothetical protein D3C73_1184010 [compost metagenome]